MPFDLQHVYRLKFEVLIISNRAENRATLSRAIEMAEHADDAQEEGQVQKKKYLDEQTQGLEKVTDYVEEQEISGLQNAVTNIEGDMARKKEEKAKRDKELAKVVVKKDDIELIVRELEISKSAAERSLREHKGDLIKALHALTD